jgi:outer membrane autotransporter protein
MSKTHNHTFGLLNSRYRNILQKCFILNALACGVAVFPALAAGDPADSANEKFYVDDNSNKISVKLPEYLKANMGLNINPTIEEGGNYVSKLYVHGTFDGAIYSSATHNYSWLINYGTVQFGYTYDDSTKTISEAEGRTVISYRHNLSASMEDAGGGVIMNSAGNNGDAILKVINTDFSSNSSLNFTNSSSYYIVVGGVISNNSEQEATIKNSTFTGNYVMGYTNIGGGAIGSNAFSRASGDKYYANTVSNGNTYTKNYAGNKTTDDFPIDNAWNGAGNVAAPLASGGAVYNTANFTSTNDIYTSKSAFGESARGGAIYNGQKTGFDDGGSLTLGGTVLFEENSVSAQTEDGYAYGGAIYNDRTVKYADGATLTYSKNSVSAQNKAMGGAVYNGNEGTMNLIGEFTENSATIKTEASPKTKAALGGAVANFGKDTITNSATYTANKVINEAVGGYAAGGAIANDGDIASNKGVFTGNSASALNGIAVGGALGNAGTYSINGDTYRGNTAEISEYGTSMGGAIFNGAITGVTSSEKAVLNITNSAVFNKNETTGVISSGGAIYNSDAGEITIKGTGGTVEFTENSAVAKGAKSYGGAIANAGNVTIETQDETIKFEQNTAQQGAALYNIGTFGGTLTGASQLTFSNNVASDKGGAIYNSEIGGINLTLSGTSKIVFAGTTDDVYNLGNITISGKDVTTTTDVSTLATTPKGTVILNSTFGGTGTYSLSNTTLQLGSTGYIDYNPVMKLTGNNIEMAEKSFINLSTDDTLSDNNFDIAKDAVLTYKASEEKADIVLADGVVNAGTINVADNVISKISISTLTSNDGTIHIDVDNPNYQADVITITDKIYGTTNIIFDGQSNLTLEPEEQRIYFAQTQADQSLSDYTFKTYAANDAYEIKVGYEKNSGVYDWYFYRTQALAPETIAYIDLPRSAVEQTRSVMIDVSRTNKGVCSCSQGVCTGNIYCRYGSDAPKGRLWAKPVYRSGTFDKPVETDIKVYGVDFGYDYQPTPSDMVGIFGSYRKGTYDNDGKGADAEIFANQGSQLDISSFVAGLYYRKYFGNLYMFGGAYGGKQSVDVKADNGVSATVDGLDFGLSAEVGYDIRTSHRSLLTPSVKATYDYIKFDDVTDSVGKKVEFDTVHDIELEAGIKYEYQFNNENQLPTTAYVKPSVIQTIGNGGTVTVAGKEFDDTLDNETLGRIEVGADAELIENFSVGAFGNYTFGSSYSAWGIGGNIRYVW